MICAVTVRQLKPGTYEQFREAWEPTVSRGTYARPLLMRNQDNEDQVLSIGFFDKTEDEFDALRDDPEIMRGEEARLRRIAQFEEAVLLNGIYVLVEEITS